MKTYFWKFKKSDLYNSIHYDLSKSLVIQNAPKKCVNVQSVGAFNQPFTGLVTQLAASGPMRDSQNFFHIFLYYKGLTVNVLEPDYIK